jgi:murein peptide amidase A
MMFREVEIGQTVLGRAIVALHFEPPSYARPRPPAVLLGAIRGDEPLGTYCLSRLCEELVERPPGRETWIIPALNVDGLAGGSQNNAHDVDLGSNFAAASWGASHRPGFHPGASPESEPETRALVALMDQVQPLRCVALCSPYRLVLWDGAGQELAEAMAALNGYEARAPERPGAGQVGVGLPGAGLRTGSFSAKYGQDRGLEVVTLEIPFLEDEEAWQQNRAALRHVVDLPV